MQQLSFLNNDAKEKTISSINIKNSEPIITNHYTWNLVHALITLPATDGNWLSSANNASMEELVQALKELTELDEKGEGHNKTRLAAIKREMKKRKREY